MKRELPYIQPTIDADGDPMFVGVVPKPLTWNDAINAMSAEEKARWSMNGWTALHNKACGYAWDCDLTAMDKKQPCDWVECYVRKMTELLNSPYDGRAQEGAVHED